MKRKIGGCEKNNNTDFPISYAKVLPVKGTEP
jgi:hypothetical protein